jgi:hypothetical protein
MPVDALLLHAPVTARDHPQACARTCLFQGIPPAVSGAGLKVEGAGSTLRHPPRPAALYMPQGRPLATAQWFGKPGSHYSSPSARRRFRVVLLNHPQVSAPRSGSRSPYSCSRHCRRPDLHRLRSRDPMARRARLKMMTPVTVSGSGVTAWCEQSSRPAPEAYFSTRCLAPGLSPGCWSATAPRNRAGIGPRTFVATCGLDWDRLFALSLSSPSGVAMGWTISEFAMQRNC